MPGKSIAKVGGKAIRFIAVARCVKNYASQFARGLSPVSAVYLMAFNHSRPQIGARHINQGPRCASIWVAIRPGSVPGECRLFDGI